MKEVYIWLSSVLSSSVFSEFEAIRNKLKRDAEEIHLRSGRKAEFVIGGTSFKGATMTDAKEIEETFFKICHGSVYAYADTICRGYIIPITGVRVGVCGSANVEGKEVKAVYGITSLNIRLPCSFFPCVKEISDSFLSSGGGLLIYSSPGIGKTTYLRALAKELSGKAGKRVSLVDTRGELASGLDNEDLMLDVLDGYPRGEGIRIAVRTMHPEVIICDEIGSSEESEALIEAMNCGASLIASAHGNSADQVVRRRYIRELHNAGMFRVYAGLSRGKGEINCHVNIQRHEEVVNDI